MLGFQRAHKKGRREENVLVPVSQHETEGLEIQSLVVLYYSWLVKEFYYLPAHEREGQERD